MKTNIINSIQKLIHLLVIFAIGFTILNNAIYLHTHILADGTKYVHAHPFNKSTESDAPVSHNHTKIEFILLDHILLLVPFLVALFTLLLAIQRKEYSSYQLAFVKSTENHHFYLRGPPRK